MQPSDLSKLLDKKNGLTERQQYLLIRDTYQLARAAQRLFRRRIRQDERRSKEDPNFVYDENVTSTLVILGQLLPKLQAFLVPVRAPEDGAGNTMIPAQVCMSFVVRNPNELPSGDGHGSGNADNRVPVALLSAGSESKI